MARPQPKIQTKSQTAVQEYMDTMLTDLFPPIPDETAEPVLKAVETEPVTDVATTFTVVTPDTATQFMANEPVPEAQVTAETVTTAAVVVESAVDLETQLAQQIEQVTEAQASEEQVTEAVEIAADAHAETQIPVAAVEIAEPVAETQTAPVDIEAPVEQIAPDLALAEAAQPLPEVDVAAENQEVAETEVTREVGAPPVELRYPNAPPWAQEDFDVLLFDVCGLKLAVSMESLGRIIKVERETNNLIGRPDWFIGAYSEAEQRLFVVDTAKYIMPEKGFDLEEEGFDYIIQLQRTQWTLACKNVQTTIRLQPDQVKWRGEAGKRPWLAGTVVDHMCALVHVDSLIELLNNEVPEERGE